MGQQLPTYARRNLRLATKHILAIKPGAVEIDFIHSFAVTKVRWHLLQFKHAGEYGVAVLHADQKQSHIEIEHPYTSLLWHYNHLFDSDELPEGIQEIVNSLS